MAAINILAICLLIVTKVISSQEAVIVTTQHGDVRGVLTDKYQVFRGIPYAAPPVGDLRWKAPVAAAPWHPRVLDGSQDGPACPQVHCTDGTPDIACPHNFSEDCLHLTVWRPASATNTSRLPVMVFIHGGNFFYGSGTVPLYDGTAFTDKGNVLLVNINYRLGALGFLVTGKGSDDATGNYGILDQRLALVWVNKNIRAFGGDPNQVTLFGQSAGAQSTLQHFMSEKSSPLISKAIVESSPASLPYKAYSEAYVLGGLFAENLGCSVGDMKCMRAAPHTAVSTAAYKSRNQVASISYLELFEPYGPSVDGVEVLGQPLEVFAQGKFSKKPLMIGSLTEETVIFIYEGFPDKIGFLEYEALLGLIRAPNGFANVSEILLKYPPTISADQREPMIAAATDVVFTCPTRNISSMSALAGGHDTWLYLYDHAFSFDGWGPNITFCKGRVCHASELPLVFGTPSLDNFTMTSDEQILSDSLISYWTNFAWSGNPNTPHPTPATPLQQGSRGGRQGRATPLLQWPRFCADNSWSLMHFKTPSSEVTKDFRKSQCDFWDSIGYYN